MIVFSAFTPHSPLLLPTIHGHRADKLTKTTSAMAAIADELYATHPETIVILSSHARSVEGSFVVALQERYQVDLKEFGDLQTTQSYFPDFFLIDRLQRACRQKEISLVLKHEEHIDYGAAVPLLLLTKSLPQVRIVLIGTSDCCPKDHLAFGELLKEICMETNARIAVIASGDQSHALSTDAPAGFHKEGPCYDAMVQEVLLNKNTGQLLTYPEDEREAAKECSYFPLVVLLGMLGRMHYQTTLHSYESPFGVGYLVAHFSFAA